MSFKKKKIMAKKVGIIDIWAYKIRVAITKYKNKDMELLWYWEKRSWFNQWDYNQHDINETSKDTLRKLGDDINESIEKAKEEWAWEIDDIILNIPFQEVFFESSKINYIRKKSGFVDKAELIEILKEIKEKSLGKSFQNILDTAGYKKENLKLIIATLQNITLDGKESKKIIGKNPKEIRFSILNIFIPEHKYEFIKSIWETIHKNIIKIVPSEYSIAKLSYSHKNYVVIDLWNSHASIIVCEQGCILWVRKLSFWIDDLIKEISKKYKKTRNDVIKSIDEPIFWKEKQKFLKTFTQILSITLEDILGKQVCPHNFFMTGWGSNKFIKQHLESQTTLQKELKMIKKVHFVSPTIEYIEDIESSKSNLNIYSMMNSTLDFIQREKDPIEESLKIVMGTK